MRLSISGVSKQFGKIMALHPLSMDVEGEIFGVIGNNGAGKSTLMKMIVGLLTSGRGKILINELNVRQSPEEAKAQIGFLPESPLLYPKLTPEELLTFIAEIRGISDVSDEVAYWLNTFGLSDKRKALLNDLSYGMKKKIALSAAFLGNPPLLLLDEPFNGLDVATMEGLSEIILQRHEKGATVLISSHLMPFIDRLCHRVIILKKGKVITKGKPEDLKKEANQISFHETFLYFMNKEV